MRLHLSRWAWVAPLALAVPAVAAVPAHPGTINYVEGQVSVNGKAATPNSIGSEDLQAGSILRTQSGKAEILLTPGVLLRVGSNSEIRMVSPGLADTRVDLNRGKAMIEATDVHKENHIQVADAGLTATIEKHGLYEFNALRPAVAVFDGKAQVRRGDSAVELTKGREVVGNGPLTVQKFDRNAAKQTDDLYKWSSLRSAYLSEASAATAQRVIVEPGWWYGPGWYWNPWWHTYAWLPAGDLFYSPFGYGFYSPWSVYRPIYVIPRYRVHGPVFVRPAQPVRPAAPPAVAMHPPVPRTAPAIRDQRAR